jgi:prophage-derived single-stranded DNA-binding protein
MNEVALIGRLTKDPEISHTTNGTHIARFTLAIQKEGKDREGADYVRCLTFNKTADVVERYLSKGKQIGLTGRLASYSYEGKDGNKVFGLEVNVNRVTLLSNNPNGKAETPTDETPTENFNPQENFEGLDEDIPF